MNKAEALAKGIQIEPTRHSMKRRSPWHDYCRKGTYMLTLVVAGRRPLLGTLAGRTDVRPNSPDAPRVCLSPLGSAILNDEVQKISRYYPMVEVWRLCIMPDHIHIIVRVKEDMPSGYHLGQVVRGFKTGCSRAWWRLSAPSPLPSGEPSGIVAATVPSVSPEGLPASVPAPVPSAFPEGLPRPVLFEPGYNDKILLHEGQLDNWKAYLDDNPRRLLIKRQNPRLFTILHDMPIAGRNCQIIGNRFLLDIPDKMAVIVHRRYSDEENARLRQEWLACGERGGVLVSAAISPKEKAVLREAMNRGYRIILLRDNGFPPLYKPSGEAFDACSAGLLLQVSPWPYHMEQTTITRSQCLALNALAEEIV